MTHVELGLLGAVIGLLGVGGGKMWGSTKIEALRKEIMSLHSRCHDTCKAERISQEHELESNLKELNADIKNQLKSMEKQTRSVQEDIKIVANKVSELQQLFSHIKGWLERNGKLPKHFPR